MRVVNYVRGSGQRADIRFALAAGIVSAGALRAAACGHVNVASVVGFAVKSAGRLAVRVPARMS